MDIARRPVEVLGLRSPGLQVSNAESLQFPKFAHVVSEGVIHHTPDPLACIGEIYRVLQPGGTAAVSVYYRGLPLRYPALFRVTQRAMPILGVSLSGRQCSTMARAPSPEDFVRQYDGAENPIGWAYTVGELRMIFSDSLPCGSFDISCPTCPPLNECRFVGGTVLARHMGLKIGVLARK